MKIILKKISIAAAALPLLLASAASCADPVTFATFTDKAASQFIFANNGTSASFSSFSEAVNFSFTSIAGMDAALQGVQDAHLTYSVSTTTAQASQFKGKVYQTMNSVTTLSIVRDTAYKTFTNLLTVTFSAGAGADEELDLNGNKGASSMNESAGTGSGHNVTFTSDFLVFAAGTTTRDIALAFTGLSAPLAVNANGFLNNFTATGSGNFSSDPVPVATTISEPGSYATLLAGLGLMGFMLRRRKMS